MKQLTKVEILQKEVANSIENNLDRDISSEDFEYYSNESEKGKSKVWILMFYPDNEDHQKIIEEIPKLFPSAVWCVHDQDVNEETGQIKKEHIHYVLYFTNDVYKSHITKYFKWYSGIDRFVHIAKMLRKRVRYLIHADNPDKYQYPIEALEGNVEAYLKFFDKQKKEQSDVTTILNLIKYKTPLSYSDLCCKINEMGCWDTFRRAGYIFNMVYKEQISDDYN